MRSSLAYAPLLLRAARGSCAPGLPQAPVPSDPDSGSNSPAKTTCAHPSTAVATTGPSHTPPRPVRPLPERWVPVRQSFRPCAVLFAVAIAGVVVGLRVGTRSVELLDRAVVVRLTWAWLGEVRGCHQEGRGCARRHVRINSRWVVLRRHMLWSGA